MLTPCYHKKNWIALIWVLSPLSAIMNSKKPWKPMWWRNLTWSYPVMRFIVFEKISVWVIIYFTEEVQTWIGYVAPDCWRFYIVSGRQIIWSFKSGKLGSQNTSGLKGFIEGIMNMYMYPVRKIKQYRKVQDEEWSLPCPLISPVSFPKGNHCHHFLEIPSRIYFYEYAIILWDDFYKRYNVINIILGYFPIAYKALPHLF